MIATESPGDFDSHIEPACVQTISLADSYLFGLDSRIPRDLDCTRDRVEKSWMALLGVQILNPSNRWFVNRE